MKILKFRAEKEKFRKEGNKIVKILGLERENFDKEETKMLKF